MWDNLPTEITTIILLKLPVKTLIVCTCLSKSFLSLITTNQFINAHIAHNPTTHFFLRYLVRAKKEENYHLEPDKPDNDDFTGFPNEGIVSREGENYHLEPDNDDFTGFPNEGMLNPFDSNGSWFTVAGCVNGVLCLVNDCSCEDTMIILWNPSIRKYVHVPKPHYVFESYGGYYSACGFGFDTVTDDYKVVRVVRLLDEKPYSDETEVEIYSLRSGCWRNVGVGPKYRIKKYDYTYIPCFFSGSVHWLGFYESREVGFSKCDTVVLKFDISKESFEIMELPSLLKESQPRCTPVSDSYVLECKGMLALIRWDWNDNHETYSVWLMKEYGMANSWTKMIELEYDGYVPRVPRAIGFRNNGEVIMVKEGGDFYWGKRKNVIVSFNPTAHGEETLLGELLSANDDIEPLSFYLCNYVESMALFREGKGIDDHTKHTVFSNHYG